MHIYVMYRANFFCQIALKMAAHVGQSLLENNIALKSSYDQLLQNAPYPTPTQSTSLLEDDDDEDWLEYIEPARTREALVEMLEQQNYDLQNQLEQVLSNQEDLDRAHITKSKQLENQIEHLQECLERATFTIQEMEENRKSRKTLTKKDSFVANLTTNTCCAEASERMKQLRSDYDHLSQSKTQIEKTLIETHQQVSALQQQYDLTSQDREILQRAFEDQGGYVDELQGKLEEYRSTLSRLRDRGVRTSVYYASSVASSDMTSLYTEDYELSTRKNTSLLTELNMAATKSYGNTDSMVFQNFCQPNVDLTVESIINQADIVDNDQLLDDALSLIGRLETEYDHSRFLQQKRHLCYNTKLEEEDDIQENNEPLKYPSLEQYQMTAVDPPTELKQEPTNFRDACVSWVVSMLSLLRFSLILLLASFFSVKKGPNSINL